MLHEVRERNERRDRGGTADATGDAGAAEGVQVEIHRIERTYEALRIADAAAESRLMASIIEQGQASPVLLVAQGDVFVLIDGYRRVRVLTQLQRDTVRAVVLPMTTPAAMVFAHRQSSGRRTCALEEAWLLRELRDAHAYTPTQLAREFGRTAGWVSRRLSLLSALPESVQQHVQSGAIGAHAAATYLVPLSRDNTADLGRLADAIAQSAISTRQVEQLVLAWKLGDPEQRERLRADPLLYLRSHAAFDTTRRAKDDVTPPVALAQALETIARICWRARKHASDAMRIDPHVLHFEDIRNGWEHASVAFKALRTRFEEHTDDRS